jgi:hypothetical protein
MLLLLLELSLYVEHKAVEVVPRKDTFCGGRCRRKDVVVGQKATTDRATETGCAIHQPVRKSNRIVLLTIMLRAWKPVVDTLKFVCSSKIVISRAVAAAADDDEA